MIITTSFRKYDRGYRAQVIGNDLPVYVPKWAEDAIPLCNETIQNRNFKEYAPGEVFNASIKITTKGRRMVKTTWLVGETEKTKAEPVRNYRELGVSEGNPFLPILRDVAARASAVGYEYVVHKDNTVHVHSRETDVLLEVLTPDPAKVANVENLVEMLEAHLVRVTEKPKIEEEDRLKGFFPSTFSPTPEIEEAMQIGDIITASKLAREQEEDVDKFPDAMEDFTDMLKRTLGGVSRTTVTSTLEGDEGIISTITKTIEEEPVPTVEIAIKRAVDDAQATVIKEAQAAVKEKRVARKAAKDTGVEGYYISPEARLIFTSAKAMSDGRPERSVKVMMVGASGYGKTTLPKIFAQKVGMSFLRMNCATIRDPEEWFGYREAVDGDTVFVKSHFAKVIEAGHAVVVLDEFNRLEPWLHNTLFPLLDDDGRTVVHDQEFKIGNNVIVVGTINSGYKYTGTFELDEALLNRFEFIMEVGPIPHDEEVKVLVERSGVDKEVANSVVKMANKLRQADVNCSTRTTLLVASMIATGLSPREAYEVALVRRIPDGDGLQQRKQVVDLLNVDYAPFKIRKIDGDVFSGEGARFATKGSSEDALEEGGNKNPAFILKKSEHVDFNYIGVVSFLRHLDTLPFGRLNFSLSQKWAKEIQAGETVIFPLSGKPDNLKRLASDIKQFGLSGRYTTTDESDIHLV